MPKIYTLQKQGSISDLKLTNAEVPDPADDEVQVKHTVIGVNRFDLHHVMGDYKIKDMPVTPGIEACGEIIKKGKAVKDFEIGNKVVYAAGLKGSFSEVRNIKRRYVMYVDGKIPDDIVVALFAKGLTAQFLCRQVYIATAKSTVVVLGAAGGVGYALCQYLKTTNAKVIAVVGSGEKKSFVGNFGVDLILDHTKDDVVAKIKEFTGNVGANCIYDCYGQGFLTNSLRAVAPFGIIVNYGDVLGGIEALDLSNLWTKSLYITRPSLFTYKSSHNIELMLSSSVLFDLVKNGKIRPKINKYSFKDIPKALKDIADNKLIGSVVAEV